MATEARKMGGGLDVPQYVCWSGSRRYVDNGSFLWGLVDMGSNGIRFSITDLSPPTSRILPTVYTYRNGISLYDAQYDEDGKQVPIPESVIQSVIGALLRFEIFCQDFRVPINHIRILATEATRTAINSVEFRRRIKQNTGLTVELLSKEDEGKVGAWGIASSFSEMRGLVMDLGGGSTQITWMITDNGQLMTSPRGAFSFPYGAAALTQRIETIKKKSKTEKEKEEALKALREEMKSNFLDAYNNLEIPPALVKDARKNGGFPLYLSGGGFRGWGYLLLYESQEHGHNYPISVINGFTAHKDDFENTERLKQVAREAEKIFRVSDRRRAQVPAVAFLVNVLAEIIPHGIKEAHFCQGGVREGVLFQKLPPRIRAQSPIEVTTAPFARPFSGKLAKLLRHSLPKGKPPFLGVLPAPLDKEDELDGWIEVDSEKLALERSKHAFPKSITPQIVRALANMLYFHSTMSKESSSTAALYSTSTGLLSSTHGVSHTNRALLALMLESRYEGDLPPREDAFREALRRLLTPAEVWWATYLGAVALVLCRVYPAGCAEDVEACCELEECSCESKDLNSPSKQNGDYQEQRFNLRDHKKPHLSLRADYATDLGKHGDKPGVRLTFTLKMRGSSRTDPMKVRESLEGHVKKIVKVGKKKHWVGGRDGWGMKIAVDIKLKYPPEDENVKTSDDGISAGWVKEGFEI